MNPLYPIVAARALRRCEYCHAPEVVFNFGFEVEHIQPQSQGGPDSDENLALTCRSCNVFKSAATSGKDDKTESTVRLFNPRTDRWEEHFLVNLESATIIGMTAIGRATVARLQMNRQQQTDARLRWIELDLFP